LLARIQAGENDARHRMVRLDEPSLRSWCKRWCIGRAPRAVEPLGEAGGFVLEPV
jgi:hypothetical protein